MMWLVKPRRLMTFPPLLTLNLLAAPLFVFIFGILRFLVPFPIGASRVGLRRQKHGHATPL